MLEDIITSWTDFPLAETIHSLQGVIAGILLACAYIRREKLESVVYTLIAMWILIAFDRYEETEQSGIGDKGWVDLKVFLVIAYISGFLTVAIYKTRKVYHRMRE